MPPAVIGSSAVSRCEPIKDLLRKSSSTASDNYVRRRESFRSGGRHTSFAPRLLNRACPTPSIQGKSQAALFRRLPFLHISMVPKHPSNAVVAPRLSGEICLSPNRRAQRAPGQFCRTASKVRSGILRTRIRYRSHRIFLPRCRARTGWGYIACGRRPKDDPG